MELIFATNNKNKIVEIAAALKGEFTIITLQEAGILIDIPEPHATIEANAIEKATVIHNLTQKNCFAEDTGLEVLMLNGEPGVRSARYAGDEADNKKNIALLSKNMQGQINRTAQFKTVIALKIGNQLHQFTGICEGEILHSEIGTKGFGYDAIFKPKGSNRSFAEMELEEKNIFSHRKKALNKLLEFLADRNG
jgi:XTP/dITP diphosphohydrolase